MTAEYASDILDRVTNITYRTFGGDTLRSFAYSYDASGLITQKVDVGQASTPVTNAYAYDGLGRLVSESFTQSGTNAFTQFSYDLAGNRLSAGIQNWTYTHNRMDGLAYDAAGNVTNRVCGAVTLSLAWNSQRQLVSVSTNGAFAESYAYDALGRRVSTTDGCGTVFHVYDGDECAADVDAAGNPLRSYTWGQGIDNLLSVTVYTYQSNSLQPTACSYFAVKDHLGSVHALVDASGQLAASYTYDAWGNVLSSTISSSLLTINSLRYLFQGREYSFATGLYNFRARWYEPRVGRWLSNDPIGISGGLNLYEFCGNDPVNFVDPWGEAWYDNWHYEGRDSRNKDIPKSPKEARDKGFKKMPDSMNIYHDNKNGKPEQKYVHSDGREVVYDGDTCEVITDPKLKGTYNYVTPAPWSWNPLKWNEIANRAVGHGLVDVLPYKLGGNVRENK